MTIDRILLGVTEFNQKYADSYRAALEKLGPRPAPPLAAMLTCTDARTLPNVITRTAPGELFTMRNVGNIMPPYDAVRGVYSDEAEAAAVEYAIIEKKVSDIIVCGHSDCAAMRTVFEQCYPPDARHLRFWLRHAEPALAELRGGLAFDASLPDLTQLAQINVITQVRHLLTYPQVRERVDAGQLAIHAWFFDLSKAEVQKWDEGQRRFVRIEHAPVEQALEPIAPHAPQPAPPPPSPPPPEVKPRPFAAPHEQLVKLIQKKRTFRTRM
jgi:carbonic anhydrase